VSAQYALITDVSDPDYPHSKLKLGMHDFCRQQAAARKQQLVMAQMHRWQQQPGQAHQAVTSP
jgi:hypothetical protein